MLEYHYLDYLKDLVGENETSMYNILLNSMYETNFYSDVEMDINRIKDVEILRDNYLNLIHDDPKFRIFRREVYGKPASLLEVLVRLSERISEIVDHPCEFWFAEMLSNLGLDRLNDDEFDKYEYEEIVKNLLDRTYCKDGKGGLFPLKNAKKDQRKVEIWYQMQEYLIENSF